MNNVVDEAVVVGLDGRRRWWFKAAARAENWVPMAVGGSTTKQ